MTESTIINALIETPAGWLPAPVELEINEGGMSILLRNRQRLPLLEFKGQTIFANTGDNEWQVDFRFGKDSTKTAESLRVLIPRNEAVRLGLVSIDGGKVTLLATPKKARTGKVPCIVVWSDGATSSEDLTWTVHADGSWTSRGVVVRPADEQTPGLVRLIPEVGKGQYRYIIAESEARKAGLIE